MRTSKHTHGSLSGEKVLNENRKSYTLAVVLFCTAGRVYITTACCLYDAAHEPCSRCKFRPCIYVLRDLAAEADFLAVKIRRINPSIWGLFASAMEHSHNHVTFSGDTSVSSGPKDCSGHKNCSASDTPVVEIQHHCRSIHGDGGGASVCVLHVSLH